jgi:hypothetical protein
MIGWLQYTVYISSIHFYLFSICFYLFISFVMYLGSFSTFIYHSQDGGKRAAGSSGSNVGYTLEEKRGKKKKKRNRVG